MKISSRKLLRYPLAVLALMLMAVGLSACAPPKPIVMVYGDSLTWESKDYIAFQMGDAYDTRVISMGGTALCDYAQGIVNDAYNIRPAFIVVSFTGNAMTPCMSGAVGEAAIASKYSNDLAWLLQKIAPTNVPVGVMTPPPGLLRTGAPIVKPATWSVGQLPGGFVSHKNALNAAYTGTVNAYRNAGVNVGLIDAYAPFAAPNTGGWTKVLPCMSFEASNPECQGGLIHVRSDDLGHLCRPIYTSTNGVISGCPVYSSGEWRYGGLMTNYVKYRLSGMKVALDAVSGGAGTVTVSGWAIDPDGDELPTSVHVYVDGAGYAFTANQSRPDVGAGLPIAGPNHGFNNTIAAAPGMRNVCVYAINAWGADRGQHPLLGCRTVEVKDPNPIGWFDSAAGTTGGINISGWGFDWSQPATALTVQVTVDGVATTPLTANQSRPDVNNVYRGAGTNHGFAAKVNTTPGARTVCVTLVNVGGGANRALGCKTATALADNKPFGAFDGATGATNAIGVSGWAIDNDAAASPVSVKISVDGAVVTTLTASQYRSDVAALYPAAGGNHGFVGSVPAAAGSRTVCATAVNTGGGSGDTDLGCRTVTVVAPPP